jgi:4-hydroxy-tetrahydrodipicolinate reductase
MSPIRLAVTGAAGRMGQEVLRLARNHDDFEVVASLERADHPEVGRVYEGDWQAGLARAQVVIDFTVARAAPDIFAAAAAARVAVVSGTTGLDEAGRRALTAAAERVGVVWAPNMSLGVNLLFVLAEEIARALPADYDIEITETHHRHKRDAPSGTAARLLQAVRAARPDGTDRFGRHGDDEVRSPGEIAVHALRGGEVVGEHTIHFFGDHERLAISHGARSRAVFVQGALQAARWIVDQPPGQYDMRDVLGLRRAAEQP